MGESYKFGYWGKTSEEILKNQFPLHRCCRDGDVVGLGALLHEANHGIYIEDSFYGWTPSHWAAYFGKLPCLSLLLQEGVHCDARTTKFHQTPSHITAYSGHSSCLRQLLHKGANHQLKDYLGETPLHKAARTGSMECISLLVAHGANIIIENNNLHTPSQLAKACGYYECARFLNETLEERAEVQEQNNGFSPVSLHTQNGHQAMSEESHMDYADNSAMDTMANNGSGDFHRNKVVASNGHHPNVAVTNGHGDADVLLNQGVGRNHVAIAGRKRQREDTHEDEAKRVRTGVQNLPSSSPSAVPSSVEDTETNLDEESPESVEMEENYHQHVTGDVLFAIGACMSPSASILGVPTNALQLGDSPNFIRRSTPSRRHCVFAI